MTPAATRPRRTRYAGPPTAVPANGSCRVPDWACFAPGTHKGRLYTAADLARIAANFARLSTGDTPALKVKAKLGHDAAQRVALSLGLPSCGTVTGCRVAGPGEADPRGTPIPPGTLVLTVEGVPEAVGREVNAGRLNDGSVELLDGFPDPADPGRTLPGPVLEAVAFLGEEQPAVKGLPAPAAVFAAGAVRTTRVVFSEVLPVRDELLQKLQAAGLDVSDPALASLTDDQLQALCNQVCGYGFAAAMRKKYAAPTPAAPAKPDAAMSDGDAGADDKKKTGDDAPAWFTSFADACTQRMGAMEASIQDMQKAKPEMQAAAAFAQEYQSVVLGQKKRTAEEAVARAVKEGRVIPAARDSLVKQLLAVDHTPKSVFSAGHQHAGKTAFDAAVADLLALPVTALFSDAPAADAAPADPLDDPDVKRAFARTRVGRHAAPAAN